MKLTGSTVLVAVLISSVLSTSLAAQEALDRYQTIDRMHHTAWTARDGLGGKPSSLAQTIDGFLWIGTSDGLFRFDGVRFEEYRPTRGAMAARAVATLAASPTGGLWIGHPSGGVTFIDAAGRAKAYGTEDSLPVARIRALAVEPDGAVWVAATGGLARIDPRTEQQWKRIRTNWGYPHLSAWGVSVDRAGTVWVGAASPNGILFLPRGSKRFISIGVTNSATSFRQLDDSTIVTNVQGHPWLQLVRRRGDSAVVLQTVLDFPSNDVLPDRDRGLWIAGQGAERLRIVSSPGDTLLRFGAKEQWTADQGLSGEVVSAVLIDREGTVWIATESGLDRFRHRNVTWDRDTIVYAGASLITDTAGVVWSLTFRQPTIRRTPLMEPFAGGPAPIDNGFVDHDGSFWLSNRRELIRWDGRRFDSIAPPAAIVQRKMQFYAIGITRDRAGRLWMAVGGAGVFFRDDSAWTFKPILDGRPDMTPAALDSDGEGRVWFAYRNEVAVVTRDSVRVLTAADGLDIGPLMAVRAGAGEVWIGGEQGVALWLGDRFRRLKMTSGMGTITGLLPTRDALWILSTGAIGRIAREAVERFSANPDSAVPVELFDLVSDLPDPLRFVARPYQWAAEGGDGVLWFVTQRGITRIDPRTVTRNPLPPPIAFRSVVADDSSYAPHDTIALPPLTRTLRIGYTALSLVIPERVRFRHRLEGWEERWHEANDRREVTYTNLRPGPYALHVMASNNDGVWNETGSTLHFTVAPAWFQTTLFRVIGVLLLLLAIALVYRMRIRRVSAAMAARYDERLAERTRIARELHDTLLQTVQGTRIVADDALEHPQDSGRVLSAMRDVSQWLGQAADEGRAALNSLRLSGQDRDLTAALRRAIDDPSRPPTMTVSFESTGEPRSLHPVAQEEITRIGIEGIRNAYLHSGATRLVIEVEFHHDLVLRMTDNGVGLNADVATAGKPGRFGIAGMRERAATIGASLTVESAAPGTRVTLLVPGRSAYRHVPGHRTSSLPH